MKIAISEIKIKDRIREEQGDLSSLQASIMKLGLLNPILITRDKELIAGMRRLTACKNLGWKEIDAIMVDADTPLKKLEIETHENLVRKDFTDDEMNKILTRKRRLMQKNPLQQLWENITQFFRLLLKKIATLFKR